MCLCSFCGGKHAFEEEILSFSEGHEVCMYSSGHSTYLKKQKKKEMPHQLRRGDCSWSEEEEPLHGELEEEVCFAHISLIWCQNRVK